MTKVVFLQSLRFEFMGSMYLSAALKKAGHDCRMLIGDSAKDFLSKMQANPPDLIAFSVMTGMHLWALEIGAELRAALGCRVVLGGPHPTFFPEIIHRQGVDIICRGEGEDALTELADALSARRCYDMISNLWVKRPDGTVRKNDVRPLCEDLDTLPDPDRYLYASYPALFRSPVQVVISSRGCPFRCSFCFNHQMRELYRDKGRYVRHRSPGAVIEELKRLKEQKRVKRIYFADDTFSLDQTWLKEFLPLYGKSVDLPFHCLVRINQVNDEMAALMRDNRCVTVFFGIESGDDSIRNEILEKAVSNEEIRRGAATLKRHGIACRTYNMVGFPGETLAQAFKTVQLNIEIGSNYPWCSIFMPYPGTRLAEYARSAGYLDANLGPDDLETSFHATSLLKSPDRDRLINLHKFFQTAVIFPASFPLVRQLIKLPCNAVFRIWFAFIYFCLYVRSEGRGGIGTLYVALKNGRFFRKR